MTVKKHESKHAWVLQHRDAQKEKADEDVKQMKRIPSNDTLQIPSNDTGNRKISGIVHLLYLAQKDIYIYIFFFSLFTYKHVYTYIHTYTSFTMTG